MKKFFHLLARKLEHLGLKLVEGNSPSCWCRPTRRPRPTAPLLRSEEVPAGQPEALPVHWTDPSDELYKALVFGTSSTS